MARPDAPLPPVAERSTREQFLPGFGMALFGSLGWQLLLLLIAAGVASSSTLRQHTRRQDDIAVLLWLGGTVLHLLGLGWLLRRFRGQGAGGVWAGLAALAILTWYVVKIVEFARALRG